MTINQKGLFIIFVLISIVTSVPQVFLPSSKFITTGIDFFMKGLFDIVTTPFVASLVSTLYTVPFAGYTRSSNNFKVGFSLHSLDIKFNDLKLQFDLKVESTSTTGFEMAFSSSQANLITFMKICYITKDPSYTEIFYIQTYRHSGPSFVVGNNSSGLPPQSFTFPLSTALPTGSVPNIVERTFLNAWNINSTISKTQNNIDIYPLASFPNQNTVILKLQTSRDNIVVYFYSMTVVYFQSALPSASPLTSEVQPTALTQFFIDFRQAVAPGATLLSITSPLKMYDYNTLTGLKGFHARSYQTVNFLNFRTVVPSETVIQFPTLNSQNMQFMKFQLFVMYEKICPPTEPYLVLYLTDCVASCPLGYVADANKNCIADVSIKLQYIVKAPDSNKLQMYFTLSPNDASFNNLYSQINWTSAISLDIQTLSKTIEYIPSPDPKLKITLEYAQDLESQDRTLTISQYDPVNYPINFNAFQAKTIKLPSLTSINNLAIKHYPDSAYQMSKVTSYLSMALSGLYMVSFLAGFAMGKVYILEMAFVPQITFLSLIGLNNVSPAMTGLGFLKYVFGYSLTQFSTNLNVDQMNGESQNYMTLIGMSTYFIYNFNVMVVFNIVAFVLFVVFYIKGGKSEQNERNISQQNQQGHKSQRKAYQFFVFDTLLYLVLWFGVWILFTGEVQVSNMIKLTSQNSLLTSIGLSFFCVNILLYIGYLVFYIRHLSRINSFQQCLKEKNVYEQENGSESKKKYFYVIYFIEKLVIASMFAFLGGLKFVNCIIAGLHVVLIVLLMVLRPYKTKREQGSCESGEEQSTLKPIMRQIINYSISTIIQILFFVTNQISSISFVVYIPLIILCLLLIQLGLTVFFLIKDQMIKKDIDYLKKLFMEADDQKENKFSQVANQTPRKKIDPNQIKIELLKKNSDFMGGNMMQNVEYANQKNIDKIQEKSDKTGQNKNGRHEVMQVDYQNYLQQINQPQNHRQNLSIDQMLELMAQKNHIRQLQQSQAEAANQMVKSAQKILEKVKKQKHLLQSQNKKSKGKPIKQADPFKLESEWKHLQDVDSSRMDKLMEFDKKRKEDSNKNKVSTNCAQHYQNL